jgi:hypothetical protein
MNREQQERVEDLGRAFTVAIREIVDMSEEVIGDPNTLVECKEEVYLSQPELVECNKAHYEPTISSVNNGFLVRMGCQQFVFETYDKMSKYLKMYFEDPNGTESKFNANELFK